MNTLSTELRIGDMSYEEQSDSPSGYAGALVKGNTMRHRTKLERLHDMKKQIEVKLDEVNKAIKLLEENPKLTDIIDALEKVGV